MHGPLVSFAVGSASPLGRLFCPFVSLATPVMDRVSQYCFPNSLSVLTLNTSYNFRLHLSWYSLAFFYLAQRYPLVLLLRCFDDFGKLFPSGILYFCFLMITQRPGPHHFQLMASRVILVIHILTSRREKAWEFKIIGFLSSMRCRNCTHQFCSNPTSESLTSQLVLCGKESTSQCRRYKRLGFDPRVGKIP